MAMQPVISAVCQLRQMLLVAIILAAGVAWADDAAERGKLPRRAPEQLQMDSQRLGMIARVVEEGLQRGAMPGCVVAIGRSDGLAYCEAFGQRAVRPEARPMTTDTVFDLASLTKPIVTATCIMKLVEEGRVDLDATAATYLPTFVGHGKEKITIRQLLTHQGGLIPDNALRDYEQGPVVAFQRIDALKLSAVPGSRFIYSDVGFIVLARVVVAVTGKDLQAEARRIIFDPLGIRETDFNPPPGLRRRAAPTELRDERWMQGEVHDPRAFRLGGVAGHAGLFSTAEDLAVYARALLGRRGPQILSAATQRDMTAAVRVSAGERALGWDKRSSYSSNRGDLFSDRAFGHGGFTGTAIWIDPELDLFVVFLSNRVHPDGKGSVNRLIGRIGTIAAAALYVTPAEKR
ncbi:MAG TPA: esterase [Planctomycetaceae bacterium]|nr:esterase [Blastopirellula sp.]HAY78895.1 esterase [Planctomycetaceae bacterium]